MNREKFLASTNSYGIPGHADEEIQELKASFGTDLEKMIAEDLEKLVQENQR